MQVTALEEYGLRCALQLAKSFNAGHLSASQIAEQEGISVEYVSKFMHLFKKSGIVKATRGVQGGFSLVDDPSKVTVKAVFDALNARSITTVDGALDSSSASGQSGPPSGRFCDQYTGQQSSCVHVGGCSIRPFWNLLASYFELLTQELTLATLLQPENVTHQQIESIFRRKFSHVSNQSTFV